MRYASPFRTPNCRGRRGVSGIAGVSFVRLSACCQRTARGQTDGGHFVSITMWGALIGRFASIADPALVGPTGSPVSAIRKQRGGKILE